MHILAKIGHETGIKKCVESELCLFYGDTKGKTPLHHFIKHSTNPDCLIYMLEYLTH
jgi:hypothetical protein